MSNQREKKFPLTLAGLYNTTSGKSARSAVLTQERADQMCQAIQSTVGGKIAIKFVKPETKKEKGDKFPDIFLEAVTKDLLDEERTFMQAQKQDDNAL